MGGLAQIGAFGGAAGSTPVDPPYSPAAPGNWSPVPTTVSGALDQLASRVVALEAASGATQQVYSCSSGVTTRDLVFKTSNPGEADLADASDPTKMRAIGFASSKPTPTSLVLQSMGELAGFGGLPLVPGTEYFADPTTPGGISAVGGDPTSGQVSQAVGIAKTDDILTISIALDPIGGP